VNFFSQAAWFSQTVAWFYGSRRIIATCTVAVLVSLMAFHVIFGANGMIVYQQKRTENKALDAESKSLQAENERLNQRIQALKTDPKTIEKEAREQLRYAKPGEVIYSIPAEKPPVPGTTAKK
jgi:cell division protein FtsB